MLKDKALVRSKIVRAVTAKEASDDLASILPISAGELTVIRAYRFYKTLSAEPKKKTYIEIDKLLPAKKAIEVMTTIENRKQPIVIRPEDLGIERPVYAGQPFPIVKLGEPQPATIIDPTTLPPDHPDHVCTDKCYDIVPLNEANEAKYFPQSKVGDPQPAKVFVPEWGPDADTSNVAAGQPSPYLFPDKPLVPTKDAVFDGEYSADSIKVLEGMGPARTESRAFVPCRWHGEKYIDQADGDRCTALDPGSRYIDDIYAARLRAVSKAPLITLGTIAAIVGLVLAYFHWFKH
jgi:hypothetical protein